MTLSGAWYKLRTDPILKFMIVALSFYGMSTFEGPMMSIKTVNALSHDTDWTIGHVHSGAIGWVAFMTIGSMYSLIPKLWGRREMWSIRLIDVHFWIATIGVVLYVTAMWIAGVMQGLMWRATNADGTLTYTFVESLKATYPYYMVRLAGGVLVLIGMFLMLYNVVKTITATEPRLDVAPVPVPAA
jgi:cytochrome c oxidase cbb3-type subunit 1